MRPIPSSYYCSPDLRVILRAKHTNIAELGTGKGYKALLAFINGIPDAKLSGIAESAHTIHQDTDFRLDMQGMTTAQPKKTPPVPSKYNLQVQINKQTTISTLKKHQPATVSMYIANKTDSPPVIRQGLLDGVKI